MLNNGDLANLHRSCLNQGPRNVLFDEKKTTLLAWDRLHTSGQRAHWIPWRIKAWVASVQYLDVLGFGKLSRNYDLVDESIRRETREGNQQRVATVNLLPSSAEDRRGFEDSTGVLGSKEVALTHRTTYLTLRSIPCRRPVPTSSQRGNGRACPPCRGGLL